MASNFTTNLLLPLPSFDASLWQDDYYRALQTIDAALGTFIKLPQFKGAWANSTAYVINDLVLDNSTGQIYKAAVAHVSTAGETFSATRLNNPAYWTTFNAAAANRGAWQTGTSYAINDFVIAPGTVGSVYAICVAAHTAGATFSADLSSNYWAVLIDFEKGGLASKTYVDSVAFSTVLPSQATNAGRFVRTDGTAANWSGVFNRVTRTANTIIGQTDNGTYVDITANTFSQTFSSAATLSPSFSMLLGNSGTGDITLTPFGAETIDGLTSFVMYPGEVRLISCTGTALISRVVNPFFRTFTASGTFVKPPGYALFSALAWSGGASGSRGTPGPVYLSYDGFGGGGGGCFPITLLSAAVAASSTVTIGAGGAARTTDGVPNAGGDTVVFGITVKGACSGGNTYIGGAIARGTLPLTISIVVGSPGATGFEAGSFIGSNANGNDPLSTIYGGAVGAGTSVYGAAGGGSLQGVTIVAPGASIFGGQGGAANTATNGVSGTAPGGGGGATRTGTQSGAGARGEVRIWGVC